MDIVERLDTLILRQTRSLYKISGVATNAQAEIAILRAKLAKYETDAVHSCGEFCQRPICVLRAERDALRAALQTQLAFIEIDATGMDLARKAIKAALGDDHE